MYILKNALKSISRAKGRNILVGIIVVMIAVASCVALSINNSAAEVVATQEASTDIVATLNVSRMLNFDRNGETGSEGQSTSREEMMQYMQNMPTLTIDEINLYGSSEYVKSYSYSMTGTINASIDPYSSEDSTDDTSEDSNMPGGFGGMGGRGNFASGDFSLKGYSDMNAMTEFISGTSRITEGSMFEDGTAENLCVISGELAAFNDLYVGDKITLVNPSNEEETYEFEICGIYENDESGNMENQFMMNTSSDPANAIYISFTAYNNMAEASETLNAADDTEDTTDTTDTANDGTADDATNDTTNDAADETADDTTNDTTNDATDETADDTTNDTTSDTTKDTADDTAENSSESTAAVNPISGQLSTSFTLTSKDVVDEFTADLTAKGMSEYYSVSTNVDAVEKQLDAVKELSDFSSIFLLIVVAVGGLILIVINMINIRERKYEVGVLTAVGMNKGKVAIQFISELFIVTFIALIIGSSVGAAVSVPVAASMLESQIESMESEETQVQQNFGGMQMGEGQRGGGRPQMGNSGSQGMINIIGNRNTSESVNYVDQINAVINGKVLLELFGIGIILTLLSSAVAIIFISRYSPLKILSERS